MRDFKERIIKAIAECEEINGRPATYEEIVEIEMDVRDDMISCAKAWVDLE